MPYLTAAMAVISTVSQASAQAQAGKAAKAAGEYQAQIAEINGKQQLAVGSANAANSAEATKYAISKAGAAAAASGVDPASGTIVNQEQKLIGQGTFNTLMNVFNGQNKQYAENAQAGADRFQGSQAAQGANAAAFGTLFKGGQSLYQKYNFDSTDGLTFAKNTPYGVI